MAMSRSDGLQMLHRLAVDQDVALVDRLQPGDGAQRRRLAAAGLAEQHDELVVVDLQVEVLDDLDGAEKFLHAAKLDLGHAVPSRTCHLPGAGLRPPVPILPVIMKPIRPTRMMVRP